MRAKGHGAHVIVTEVDPMKALEAVMDGFQVMPMERAAEVGDVFVTATGDKHVIARGTSSGSRTARSSRTPATSTSRSTSRRSARSRPRRAWRGSSSRSSRSPTGARVPPRGGSPRQPRRRRGHPAQVMDMSFAQPGARRRVRDLQRGIARAEGLRRPQEIDDEIARLKLATMGVAIDELTEEQAAYLASWDEGT
jgi:adenosylhomocysteinase